MCGIAGILGERAADVSLADRMVAAIRHRGPDQSGRFTSPGVTLAMNRLAIIDIPSGNQPMLSADGRVAIIYNGEVYNFEDLRGELASSADFRTRSDTEVVLQGYLRWGDQVFERLNGIYAVAIWDGRSGQLVLARDPLGVKPLYLLRQPGGVFFASELKSFTRTGLADIIERQAVWQFLAAGYVFHPDSALSGVYQLQPGEVLTLTCDGKQTSRRLTLPMAERTRDRPEQRWETDAFKALCGAVKRQTVADVPYGLLLSSGLDSMAVLASLRTSGLVDGLSTFTLDVAEQDFSEAEPVSKLAQQWGFRNERIVLTPGGVRDALPQLFDTFDNLELLPTSAAIHALSQTASRDVRVLLAGNGGDEIFAGYPTYRASHLASRLRPLVAPLRLLRPLARRIHASDAYLGPGEKLRRLLMADWSSPPLAHLQWRHVFLREEIAELLTEAWTPPAAATIYDRQLAHWREAAAKNVVGLAAMMWTDVRSWLVDCGLSMWDKAGMSASVEIRVPLLDIDLMRHLNTIPLDVRAYPLGSKAFLRHMLAPIVPEYILNRPKHGLQLPVAAWMRGDLRKVFYDLTHALPESVVQHRAVARLWRDLDDGAAENGLKLWCLGCLSGWADTHRLRWE